MRNIGYIYYNKGDFEKALELYKATLIIQEKVYGSDDDITKRTRVDVANATGAINNKETVAKTTREMKNKKT